MSKTPVISLRLDDDVRPRLELLAKSQRRDIAPEIYYLLDLFLDLPDSQADMLAEREILAKIENSRNTPTGGGFAPNNIQGQTESHLLI